MLDGGGMGRKGRNALTMMELVRIKLTFVLCPRVENFGFPLWIRLLSFPCYFHAGFIALHDSLDTQQNL